jgi:hypothetical protein
MRSLGVQHPVGREPVCGLVEHLARPQLQCGDGARSARSRGSTRGNWASLATAAASPAVSAPGSPKSWLPRALGRNDAGAASGGRVARTPPPGA